MYSSFAVESTPSAKALVDYDDDWLAALTVSRFFKRYFAGYSRSRMHRRFACSSRQLERTIGKEMRLGVIGGFA